MSSSARRSSDPLRANKQSVRVGEKVFVKLSCGKWTVGEVISICEVSDDVKIKFCPTAKLSLPPWVRIHRTERSTFSIRSPDWKKDYQLLELHEQDKRRQNEELARERRFARLQRLWEEEAKQRDWSRTWSCKSRKQYLQHHREDVKKRTEHQIQLEQQRQQQAASSRSAARARGAPVVTDSTTNGANNMKKEDSKAVLSRREKRFRFDPNDWASRTITPQCHEDMIVATESCDDKDEVIEVISSSSSLSDPDDDGICNYHYRYADDEFYLSEEDLPELNGSCSLSLFFQEELSRTTAASLLDDSTEIALHEGESVTIIDEKSGFLRSESGPQLLRLARTERIVASGAGHDESSIFPQTTQSISIIC